MEILRFWDKKTFLNAVTMHSFITSPAILLDTATRISHKNECHSLQLVFLLPPLFIHSLGSTQPESSWKSPVRSYHFSTQKFPMFSHFTQRENKFLQWSMWPSTIWMVVCILTSSCALLFLVSFCSSHTSLLALPQHPRDTPTWIWESFILRQSQSYFS